ncbi:MAG: hypothetical protein J2P53_18770, partial [Bradyrhizobiaceae bacterium]|nr:hypothetical protein [Bradyrhizobiaceae bacterium]
VRAGAGVLVCTRKEHVTVKKPDTVPASPHADQGVPAAQTFIGVTKAASFLGFEEEYVVAIDGMEMGAVQPACGLRAGEPVAVTIRCDDVIVFAAEIGDDGA